MKCMKGLTNIDQQLAQNRVRPRIGSFAPDTCCLNVFLCKIYNAVCIVDNLTRQK